MNTIKLAASFAALSTCTFAAASANAAAPAAPIAIGADSVHYATVNNSNAIEVTDRTGAHPKVSFGTHDSTILALAFSRDGSYIASADASRIIDIWSVKSGKIVRAIHEPKVSKERVAATAVSRVTSLAFNGLGTDLVIVDNGYGTIGRYHGSEPAKLGFEDAFYTAAPLTSVASDGQGGWVAGDGGGAIHFFDSSLKEIGATTSKMASSVRTLAVSADSAYLATGGDDNEVKVWNFGGSQTAAAQQSANFTLAQRYPVGAPVTALAFRTDWKTIVFASDSGKMDEWSYLNNLKNPGSAAPAPVLATAAAPTVPPASAESPIQIAAPVSVAAPAVPAVPGATVESSLLGTATAASLPPPPHMQLSIKKFSQLVGHSDYVNEVAFSPDGRTLASASRDRTVRLWDVAGGRQETILGKHTAYVSAIAFSPDGRTLASGGWDDKIKLFDVASQSENGRDQRLPKAGSFVLSLEFSPDGSHLVSGSNDRTARLFNTATGASRASALLPDGVASVAFSPDGSRIAGGCLDGTVYVWDAATMHRLHAFRPAAGARPVYCIAFLDNDTLAAGGKGGSLNVWNMSKGLLATLPAGGQDIFGLAFDGPRQLLAAGGADRLIRFWPAEALRQAKNGAHIAAKLTLSGHKNTVRTLAFNADGTMLASGGWDYSILLWSVAEKPDYTASAGTEGHAGQARGNSGMVVASR